MITRQTYSEDEAHRYLTPSPVNEVRAALLCSAPSMLFYNDLYICVLSHDSFYARFHLIMQCLFVPFCVDSLSLPLISTQLHTGCASDDKAYGMISWQGRELIDQWYVPDSYTYPAMPWADPAVTPITTMPPGGVAGEMNQHNLTGNTVFGRRGTGITSGYLDYDLTDGEPISKEESVVFVQALTTKQLQLTEKSDVGGVPTNTFVYNYPSEYTAAEDEERQRSGQMPYAHLYNLRYSKGIAGMASLPNWFGVEDAVYSQENNTAAFGASGGGVTLYRTRDSYSSSAALLEAPVAMTGASVAAYESELKGYTKLEPASGAALSTRVQNMASSFSWYCNPAIDSTCALMASAFDSADPLCYPNMAGAGTQLPCSNANVFTPRVRGGKVLPLFWTRATLEPDIIDTFLVVMDTRHALAVLSLALPLVLLVTLGVFGACSLGVYSDSAAGSASGAGSNRGDVETAKLVQEDAGGDLVTSF